MRRLVLADDSKTIQKVVALLFEEEDFEVHCFENGATALEHIRSRGADVVLADVSLPILDGYELCREIKQDPRTALLPVVLLAGTMEPLDEQRAAVVNHDGSLTKPFETSRLIRVVKDLVEEPLVSEESETAGDHEAATRPGKVGPESPFDEPAEPETQRELLRDSGVMDEPSDARVEPELPIEVQSYSDTPDDGVIVHLPVFLSAGKVYFELTEEQCVPSLTPLSRVVERPSTSSLTANQLDALADEVLKRLPETVRSLLPDIAKSMLKE